MDQEQIGRLVKQALETGKWMLRRSNDGTSYGGFQWKPVGEWTEAPDWDPMPCCGGGLHGSAPEAWGYFTDYPSLDFCITDGERVSVGDDKIKVPRAMILLRNALPEGLMVRGSLDLRGTQVTTLPEELTVGGSLNLSGTQITALPEGLTVGGSLDLSGTQITALPEGLTVGGSLYLSGTQITALPEGAVVEGKIFWRE